MEGNSNGGDNTTPQGGDNTAPDTKDEGTDFSGIDYDGLVFLLQEAERQINKRDALIEALEDAIKTMSRGIHEVADEIQKIQRQKADDMYRAVSHGFIRKKPDE